MFSLLIYIKLVAVSVTNAYLCGASQNCKTMHVISLTKFRTNQTAILLRALKGESVLLTSRLGAFRLTPVSAEEKIVSRISEGLKEARRIETEKLKPRAQTAFSMGFDVKTTPHFNR